MVQAKLNETISIFSFYYNKVQKKRRKKAEKEANRRSANGKEKGTKIWLVRR